MISLKLKQRFTGQFTRNIGWLGIAELVNRIFRLGTTVTLARLFDPHDYGLVAIIYTVHSFADVFSLRAGIGAKIIQAEEPQLESICQTAYWLNWLFCIALVIVQCLLAYPVALFYEERQLIFPICVLSLMYLMFPIFMVQSALVQRENRLKIIAICTATQSIISNLIIVCLALLGCGVWAVVWAMVLSTPVWIFITYRNHSWRPSKAFTIEQWRDITSFGSSMLGIELLDKIRLNLDYLIVGRFLSIEALGIYFFAFSAGLGISQNVVNAIISALFPYLCEVRDNLKKLRERCFSSFKTIAMIIVPLVLLQSSLAPLYVPIVFGSKWNSAIPILMIICLSAIPLAFTLATYQLLNSVGKIKLTLQWNIIYTIVFASTLLLAVRGGVLSVAITVLVCQILTLLFSTWATQNTFKALD
ncbi:lipopolysaccharide biosynthesis protein [Gloeocapsopsis crepidinum LEGE 06123]|uniref:Lipopolysaccharide biosynthesis protein n=1 Tax=Gloeocapsopsis crepidinum LEGE 06123 TaxID=588587 RepID=A0ABR9ULC2_9CHRO|nr:lipopolysaccharide biosynthesis protein [Gloeocapsopsis crepidinum]MBE9188818.1 lipopolysaccharide biosynthesis protein [Gloeocapsopsis crepidinum LEGE 06123]